MPSTLISGPIAREAPSDTISSNMTSLTTSASTTSKAPSQKLSETLPPLVFGTATLNYQFNVDPYALHPNTLVSSALASGIRAFDTSPYYGPAEEILGTALHSTEVTSHPALKSLRREDYAILTKAGRIRGDEFDYSPEWIRHSVRRSLKRLRTSYLDVVYLHDVEFVSPEEVLSAIRTLREIRDQTGTVKHVGICGYPVLTLVSLSEMILAETGEPLDIVQSYANFTVQNRRLKDEGLARLISAGVDVVTNASPLGMGLLRGQGVPIGSMGNWHPAPDDLRAVCLKAAEYVQEKHGEKLEDVAVRFAMENWLGTGSVVGSKGPVPREAIRRLDGRGDDLDNDTTSPISTRPKLGVNVMGVSKLSELDSTMAVYNSIIATSGHSSTSTSTTPDTPSRTNQIASEITAILGSWLNHAWSSPDPGFVNQRTEFGVSEAEKGEVDGDVNAKENVNEKGTLETVVKQLKDLETSVNTAGAAGVGDGKTGTVEVGVEETVKEMTPPR